MKQYESWGAMLAQEVEKAGDTIVSSTLTKSQSDEQFSCGYGCSEGCEFTAWGEKYVYFPATYDGAEWIAKVPRNPCDEPTKHVGG